MGFLRNADTRFPSPDGRLCIIIRIRQDGVHTPPLTSLQIVARVITCPRTRAVVTIQPARSTRHEFASTPPARAHLNTPACSVLESFGSTAGWVYRGSTGGLQRGGSTGGLQGVYSRGLQRGESTGGIDLQGGRVVSYCGTVVVLVLRLLLNNSEYRREYHLRSFVSTKADSWQMPLTAC
eukprot:1195216-Prorocentrum_minimum.AAC.2